MFFIFLSEADAQRALALSQTLKAKQTIEAALLPVDPSAVFLIKMKSHFWKLRVELPASAASAGAGAGAGAGVTASSGAAGSGSAERKRAPTAAAGLVLETKTSLAKAGADAVVAALAAAAATAAAAPARTCVVCMENAVGVALQVSASAGLIQRDCS